MEMLVSQFKCLSLVVVVAFSLLSLTLVIVPELYVFPCQQRPLGRLLPSFECFIQFEPFFGETGSSETERCRQEVGGDRGRRRHKRKWREGWGMGWRQREM